MDSDNAIIEDEEMDEETRLINEEYTTWKKNAPYLYDTILSHALEWPSLSVQWVPGCVIGRNKDYSEQKVYLSTHTSKGEQNYVIQATVQMPLPDTVIDMRKFDSDGNVNAGYQGMVAHVTEVVRINHDGEVNKARYMPQNPMMLATKTVSGDVFVFDITKHPSIPRNSACSPNYILKGHQKEGYGLSWSPLQEGYIASGSDDQKVCVWDLQHCSNPSAVQPIREYTEQTDIVEDVSWHPHDRHVLAACGDDQKVYFYDCRLARSITSLEAHKQEVNVISFNPVEKYLFATASNDQTVALWDYRNLESPLHSLVGHKGEIFSCTWNTANPHILASAGVDRRVHIWDISRIGMKVPEDQVNEGPAELVFVHGGHTSKINDISWNPNDEWTIASVADDNVLQIWQPADAILNPAISDNVDLNSAHLNIYFTNNSLIKDRGYSFNEQIKLIMLLLS